MIDSKVISSVIDYYLPEADQTYAQKRRQRQGLVDAEKEWSEGV